jgi:superfamily II DNA helicase RecQ
MLQALISPRCFVSHTQGGGKSLCFQLPPLIHALRVTEERAAAAVAPSGQPGSIAAGVSGTASGVSGTAAGEYKTAVVVTPQIALMRTDATVRTYTSLLVPWCARAE